MWAHIGGWSVVAGFLIPVPVPQYSGTGALWTWDIIANAPLEIIIGLVAPPLAGLAILGMVFFSSEDTLPRIMTIVGGVTLGAEVMLGVFIGTSLGGEISTVIALPFVTGALALIGAFTIAAANRLRKAHPHHPWPGLLAGIGGILVILFYVLPVRGRTVIGFFFEGDSWRTAWPMMLGLIGFLGYGIAGIVCFKKFQRPKKACAVMSILGRVALILLPVSFVVFGLIESGPGDRTVEGQAPIALIVLKVYLSLYGVLLIFSAGLAALGTLYLKPASALAATPAPPPPPAPTV